MVAVLKELNKWAWYYWWTMGRIQLSKDWEPDDLEPESPFNREKSL